MTRHMGWLRVLVAVVAVLVLGAAGPEAWAQRRFAEADIFFELNNTDGDLGFHALIDGRAWKQLIIKDKNEREILNIAVQGRLGRQGLTELFFESAEPPFDQLSPEQFFRRFPEGEYIIEGVTRAGNALKSTDVLSHVMPAPPENVTISGVPAAANCDTVPLPSVSKPITISWDPVTGSHPQIGKPGVIEVDKYQVVIEREEPTPLQLSVDLPPTVTAFKVPSGLIKRGEEIKFEILVREASGNQTAIESCFVIE